MKVAAALGLLVAVLWAYAPLVRTPWVYEDSNALWLNPAVTGTQPIQVTRARWLSALSHRLVFRVSDAPRATHLVNLALHLVNGLLVWAIARVWFTGWAPLVALGVFWLHPLQTEAVAYGASRSELLAAAFGLWAFWLLIRRPLTWWSGSGVALGLGLALCAKETAVVLVGLSVLYLLTFRPRAARRAVGPLTFAIFVAAVVAVSVLLFDHRTTADLSRLGYAATQAAAVWRYVGLFFVPVGQTIDHDFELVAWGVRGLALAGLAWVSLLVFFLWLGRTRPVLVMACAWPLVALAPRFVMRIPELLNEHQLYLPMVGAALLAGCVVGTEQRG